MSLLAKFIAAVVPAEDEALRRRARERAMRSATPGDWLALVLQHHRSIESAFADCRAAEDTQSRRIAHDRLSGLVTAHSLAEEAVLYPALAKIGGKTHSLKAYSEQSEAKMQLGLLQDLSPMSRLYADKLEQLAASVAHHMYEEESTWFLELKSHLTTSEQHTLSLRYDFEYARYGRDDLYDPALAQPSWVRGAARYLGD